MIKKLSIIILSAIIFIASACTFGENSISVTFQDITGVGSQETTFRITYEEEKRYKDKGVDILIKSDQDNTEFLIKKELEDFVKITLKEKDVYYSLNKLMCQAKGEKFVYSLYKDAVSKSYIINSQQQYNINLKAVVGNVSELKTMLFENYSASKVFSLKIKKSEN